MALTVKNLKRMGRARQIEKEEDHDNQEHLAAAPARIPFCVLSVAARWKNRPCEKTPATIAIATTARPPIGARTSDSTPLSAAGKCWSSIPTVHWMTNFHHGTKIQDIFSRSIKSKRPDKPPPNQKKLSPAISQISQEIKNVR